MVEKSKKRHFFYLWIITCISSILSVSSFFISKDNLEFDKINFIIAVLAVLVTILVCFQIYNSIQIKDNLDKFEHKWEKHKEQIDKEIEGKIQEIQSEWKEDAEQSYSAMGLEFYNNFLLVTMLNDYPIEQKVIYQMTALFYVHQIKNIDEIEQLSEYYTHITNQFDNFIEDNKKDIRNIDNQIKESFLRKMDDFIHLSTKKTILNSYFDRLKTILLQEEE